MTQTPAHHVYSRSPMLQHVTHPPPSCHVMYSCMYSWRPGRVETRRPGAAREASRQWFIQLPVGRRGKLSLLGLDRIIVTESLLSNDIILAAVFVTTRYY